MNKYLAVLSYDMKNTFRDPSLIMILVAPFLIILVLMHGYPLLIQFVPQASEYKKEAVSLFALISSVFPGFIMSFILFDEKDVQLFPVIKATPVSLSGFLKSRLGFMVFVGFIMSLFVFMFNGIYAFPITTSILASLLAGLNSPILILFILNFAKNKVEGLMMLKIATIILFIPIIIFFLDSNWENLFAIFPAFWVYALIEAQNTIIIFSIGLMYILFLNYFIFKLTIKKN